MVVLVTGRMLLWLIVDPMFCLWVSWVFLLDVDGVNFADAAWF